MTTSVSRRLNILRKMFRIIAFIIKTLFTLSYTGADPGFQVRGGGGALKKMRRAEGGAKNVGVFTCEKSRFYAKKSCFPILGGGGGARRVRPPSPWIRP